VSKALTVESYEDELKPLILKPQDSEFTKQMRISFDLETTEYEKISKEQVKLATDRFEAMYLDILDYLFRDYAIHAFPSVATSTRIALCDILKSRFIERFPIPTGIVVKEEEITIDPKKLEPNIFYLFSYQNEKYVARKTEKGIVEIYEVTE